MSKTVFVQTARVTMSPDGVVSLEILGREDEEGILFTALELFMDALNDKGLGLGTGDEIEVQVRVTSGGTTRH